MHAALTISAKTNKQKTSGGFSTDLQRICQIKCLRHFFSEALLLPKHSFIDVFLSLLAQTLLILASLSDLVIYAVSSVRLMKNSVNKKYIENFQVAFLFIYYHVFGNVFMYISA